MKAILNKIFEIKHWWSWRRDLRLWKRNFRYLRQLLTRGWCDYECWNLDIHLASHISEKLKRFKDFTQGHPIEFNPEGWDNALSEIIEAFDLIASDINIYKKEDLEKVQKGLDLFAKHFMSLWD